MRPLLSNSSTLFFLTGNLYTSMCVTAGIIITSATEVKWLTGRFSWLIVGSVGLCNGITHKPLQWGSYWLFLLPITCLTRYHENGYSLKEWTLNVELSQIDKRNIMIYFFPLPVVLRESWEQRINPKTLSVRRGKAQVILCCPIKPEMPTGTCFCTPKPIKVSWSVFALQK